MRLHDHRGALRLELPAAALRPLSRYAERARARAQLPACAPARAEQPGGGAPVLRRRQAALHRRRPRAPLRRDEPSLLQGVPRELPPLRPPARLSSCCAGPPREIAASLARPADHPRSHGVRLDVPAVPRRPRRPAAAAVGAPLRLSALLLVRPRDRAPSAPLWRDATRAREDGRGGRARRPGKLRSLRRDGVVAGGFEAPAGDEGLEGRFLECASTRHNQKAQAGRQRERRPVRGSRGALVGARHLVRTAPTGAARGSQATIASAPPGADPYPVHEAGAGSRQGRRATPAARRRSPAGRVALRTPEASLRAAPARSTERRPDPRGRPAS